jgi:phage repressor protein C with HTH and peptisase S24 domain
LRDIPPCGTYIVVRRFRNQMFGTTQSRREMEVKGFRIACGEFIGVSDVREEELEQPGMALVPQGIRYAKGMFAARSRGDSMEPKISDGMWCLFHPDVVGTRHDRFVLVEDQSKISGDRYTLKKYHSRKMYLSDGTWRHNEIFLLPSNPGHSPIRLENEETYRICGWFVDTVSQIQPVEQFQYRYVAEE